MTKNIALITRALSGQHIDHVSMELLKWHIPYVLKAYVPVEIYGDGNFGTFKAIGFVWG